MATAVGVVRLRRRRAASTNHKVSLDNIKEEDQPTEEIEEEMQQEENPIEDDDDLELETGPLDDDEIERNLQQAKEHARMLQRAHDHFDRRQRRFREEKGPVRQRLGVVRVQRMGPAPRPAPRVSFANGNSGQQRQIVRRRPRGSGASVVSVATNGTMRRRLGLKRLATYDPNNPRKYHINTAQSRMERVRAQLASNTCPVRLRRNPRSARANPNNLTVHVTNYAAAAPSTDGQTYPLSNCDRFRLRLDPSIQALIRQVQADASLTEFYPIGRITPEKTEIYLSTRFSELT